MCMCLCQKVCLRVLSKGLFTCAKFVSECVAAGDIHDVRSDAMVRTLFKARWDELDSLPTTRAYHAWKAGTP